MNNLAEVEQRLLETLKELKREVHYRGLMDYVRDLKKKEYLNGKESYILRGAAALLKRLEADRKSISLGLINFIPYFDRRDEPKEIIKGNYLSWDRSVCLLDMG